MADKTAKIAKLAEKSKWKNLAPFVNDGDVEVRIAALNALTKSEDPQFAQMVAMHLNDPDARVRIATANCLGGIATNREVEQVRYKMESEQDEAVKAALHECLKNAKGGKREKTVYNPARF